MKKAALLTAFVLVVALLVSCAEKGAEQLAGSWQRKNGSDTITFSKDEKVQLVCGSATISSTYKLGKGDLQLDLGILGTPAVKYTLSKDELTLTDSHGKEVKYLRVKETTAVPAGVIAVGVNPHRNRALFPLVDDPVSGVAIPPVAVQVARVPAAARLPAENIAQAE